MSQPTSRWNRTDDLSWATTRRPPGQTCYFCRRPDPQGTALLGGRSRDAGGAEIAVCSEGTGCQDGRVYHGPAGPAHRLGEDCAICARAATVGQQRMTGNSARRTSRTAGNNSGRRH